MDSFIPYLGNWLKTMLIACLSKTMNFFAPIENFFVVIMVLATVDMFCGLAADKGEFRKSKFFRSVIYLGVYILIVSASYWIGFMMEHNESDTKGFVSWITWVMIWFYSTNSLKNTGKIFPDNRVVAFLYWVAAVKFIRNVNFLEEFNNKDKKGSPDSKG